MIQPIDNNSVRQICCGQVIVDLVTAVKELVENSLDAKATSIEVLLKDMGAESIVVADNGVGINPDNYESVALKHFTSKISAFEDLSSLYSFGFRGEALSALCEISQQVGCTTRQADQEIGNALSFSRSGLLTGTASVARGAGTTFTVEGLFSNLPVRRAEFQRGLRTQYHRLLGVLQGYALISTDVRFSVTNITNKGARQTVLGTQRSPRLADNIAAVFGSQFLAALCPLEVSLAGFAAVAGEGGGEVEGPVHKYGDADLAVLRQHSISGYVSRAGAGIGRADADRQYLFINRRPVDIPRVNRLFNELWRRYEMKHKPAFVVNLTVPPGAVDVNLTPDKREVLLMFERPLLDGLRDALLALFEPSRGSFQVNDIALSFAAPPPAQSREGAEESGTARSAAAMSPCADVTARTATVVSEHIVPSVATPEPQGEPMSSVGRGNESPAKQEQEQEEEEAEADLEAGLDTEAGHVRVRRRQQKSRRPAGSGGTRAENAVSGGGVRVRVSSWLTSVANVFDLEAAEEGAGAEEEAEESDGEYERSFIDDRSQHEYESESGESGEESQEAGEESQEAGEESQEAGEESQEAEEEPEDAHLSSSEASQHPVSKGAAAVPLTWSVGGSEVASFWRKRSLTQAAADADACDDGLVSGAERKRPRTAVAEGIGSEAGVRILTKRDFASMRVLGQFNLGFIICQIDMGESTSDLFILDQHACDEKYTFEGLLRSGGGSLHQQPALRPYRLPLTASDAAIVRENMPIFTANGFKLLLRAPGGGAACDNAVDLGGEEDVWVHSLPISKGYVFTDADISELISLLRNGGGGGAGYELDGAEASAIATRNSGLGALRLPKLVDICASRACRRAVMIGTALSAAQMSDIVRNLGGIDQPWNCPHGRPTMRHLCDLKTIL